MAGQLTCLQVACNCCSPRQSCVIAARPSHVCFLLRRCAQAYYSYSLIIVGITLFSIVTNVVSAYQYRRRLAALAHYTCEVQVRPAPGERQSARFAGMEFWRGMCGGCSCLWAPAPRC